MEHIKLLKIESKSEFYFIYPLTVLKIHKKYISTEYSLSLLKNHHAPSIMIDAAGDSKMRKHKLYSLEAFNLASEINEVRSNCNLRQNSLSVPQERSKSALGLH